MESLNSKSPVLTVEDVRPAKSQGFSTLRLRWKVQEANGSNFLGQFLGNLESKGRVAFQTISDSILKEMDIKVGANLNEKLPAKARITITELSQSEVNNLEVADARGFSPKINPSTKEYLVDANGEYVYRNTKLTPVDMEDSFINHAGVTSDAPEEVNVAAEVSEDDIPA